MPRSVWKGSISFGLVSIPVSLASAEKRSEVQLHMVDSENHARIRYERVNAQTGAPVPWERMVRGYEYEEGRFILLNDEELERIHPELTKNIEIEEFVKLSEIDPLLYEKPYYLEPEKRGRRAYALLRAAMEKSGMAGISRVVIRTREYLSAMFSKNNALVLMLLRFPDELLSASKLDLPETGDKQSAPAAREMDLALKLIQELSARWEPEKYHDIYQQSLLDYIENKVKNGETVADVTEGRSDAEKSGGNVVDLAEYLARSIKNQSAGKPNSMKKDANKSVEKKVRKHA